MSCSRTQAGFLIGIIKREIRLLLFLEINFKLACYFWYKIKRGLYFKKFTPNLNWVDRTSRRLKEVT